MSELEGSDLITLIYDARSRVGAIKHHADRLHLLALGAKLATAQQTLIEATALIKEKPESANSDGATAATEKVKE